MKTKRTYINKITAKDKIEISKLFSNEEVRKYLGGPVSKHSFNNCFNNMCNSKSNHYFVVRSKNSLELIGLVSIDTYHNNKDKELSYQLLPQWWGNNYATEVLAPIINYAFTSLNLPVLYAETQTKNKASCSLLQKLGFSLKEKILRFNAEQAVYCKYNNL